METTPEHEVEILDPNRMETCDECGPGTQAYVFALWPDGRELTYCGHHGTMYKAGMIKAGATVHDLTYLAFTN